MSTEQVSEGMAAKSGPNDPAGRGPSDKVRRLQRRLWAAAKRSRERRFHALFDHIWRGDVLREAWRRVRRNKGAAGVDGKTLVQIEQQGGVISPLLSNIYLHVLDVLWMRHSAPLGVLVRYADDFVVMCKTRSQCEQAEERIRVILERLGLELHPDKTRRVELYDGREGFDFLGCHLHKRLSGTIWERTRKRLYFLHRWPSQRAMKQIRQRVKQLTPRGRCHADIREVIAELNPVLRGWGNYFRTGNAAKRFNQLDTYVERRLRRLLVQRKGRHLRAGEFRKWTREYFEHFGLHRLRGTVRYPETVNYRDAERPPVSRVREIRTHGLKGGPTGLAHQEMER